MYFEALTFPLTLIFICKPNVQIAVNPAFCQTAVLVTQRKNTLKSF